MLQRIIQSAVDLADATYGALGVLDDTGTRLAQFITVGIDDETHRAIGNLPEGHGILGLLIVDAKPLRLADLSEHPDSFGFPPNHPPMRSFLGVPIRVRDQVFGNLYLTDKKSGEVFTDVDEEVMVGLAAAAGVAIENVRLHTRLHELAVVEDRERIARDLHDTVIQQLFATGMSLQAATARVDDAAVTERIQAAVDDLDRTIRDIRSTIFALQPRPRGGVRDEVLAITAESAGALGFDPHVRFSGSVDALVDKEVASHLFSTLREALANVARHAAATRSDVEVAVSRTEVRLLVLDNGIGISADRTRHSGLRNITERAEALGGTAAVAPVAEGGTQLEWRVPLDRSGQAGSGEEARRKAGK
jgi:signal transduction histidine kinase